MTEDAEHTIFAAIENGDVEQVEHLVVADPNWARSRKRGAGPLLYAHYCGQAEVVRSLRASHPRLNPFEAAALGDLSALEEELPQVRDLDALSEDGWSPLHLGAFFGHLGVVRLLLDRGASVSVVSANPEGNQPLHAAVTRGWADIAVELLEAGADPNVPQITGYTSLHLAAHRGDDRIVSLLLDAGAEVAVFSDKGESPDQMANQAGFTELADHLKSAPRD